MFACLTVHNWQKWRLMLWEENENLKTALSFWPWSVSHQLLAFGFVQIHVYENTQLLLRNSSAHLCMCTHTHIHNHISPWLTWTKIWNPLLPHSMWVGGWLPVTAYCSYKPIFSEYLLVWHLLMFENIVICCLETLISTGSSICLRFCINKLFLALYRQCSVLFKH